MTVRGARDESAALAQHAHDGGSGVERAPACQRAERIEVAAILANRCDGGQAMLAAEIEVLLPAAGRDVDEPCAFIGRHLVPRDHPMSDAALGGQVVEGADVGEPQGSTPLTVRRGVPSAG